MAEEIQESKEEGIKRDSSKPESSSTLQEIQSEGEVIINDRTGDKYVIMQQIGDDYSATVYKGRFLPMHIDDYNGIRVHDIALKVINRNRRAESKYLSQQLQRSRGIQSGANIVGVMDSFTDGRRLFVSMEYSDMGSLRSIMSTQFTGGLTEDYIAVALRETVKGLCFLHERSCIHKDIHAGNIFVYGKPEIKLAYAATVYEHNGDDHEASSFSAMTARMTARNISIWGRAPEVYSWENRDTEKTDIWLIGITALELAYGGLRMATRKEFEEMIKKINRKRRLPGTIEKRVDPEKDKGKKLLDLGKQLLSGEWWKKERRFSEAFEEMVIKCVAWNADERPSANELLQSKFFMEAGDVIIFKNLNEAGEHKGA